MRLLATFWIALRALRRNTMRTILTMLGIIIGVGAVIAMVSIGNGAKAQIEAQIASLGQNVILIMTGNASRGGFRMGFGSAGTLTKEDYEAIRAEVRNVNGASPEVNTFAQVAAGNQNSNVQIKGVGADYIDVRAWELVSGNNITDTDVRNSAKVALIGKTTATTLYGDEDPIGKIIRIKNAPFVIVGALAPKGMSMMGGDQDDVVLVPYTSAMKRLMGQNNFRSIFVQAATAEVFPEVQSEITELLRQRHKIGDGREDDFMVQSQQEISDRVSATTKTMTMLLGSIAGVSLLVGGIGIMNIMLVSVTERTREIGIRMSVGAKGHDILMQFLIEAVTLSVIGGSIGIAMGVGISQLLAKQMNWPALTSMSSIIIAFCFSGAVGIFFGFYPAQKASRLDPIDALRYE
ncbi:MAG TPA: ABC transporter permease [Verrucomicrobiae bacterium]|nr:ABC transporter permease [Verrucomicrobiae bacterium]